MNDKILPLREYVSSIRDAVLAQPENTIVSRRLAYELASRELVSNLEKSGLSLTHDVALYEIRLFHYATRYIERDIRAGIDILSSDYVPAGLDKIREKLISNREATLKRGMLLQRLEAWRRGIREGIAPAGRDGAGSRIVQSLKEMLTVLDRISSAQGEMALSSRMRIIRALLIHRIHLLVSTGRFIYFWLVLEITLLGSALVFVHSFLGWHHVLNMDVATFAATGVATWIMMHRTIRDVYQALAASRHVINFSMVAPIDAAVSEALFGMPIYMLAQILILTVGWLVGLTVLPDRPVTVLVIWLGLWLLACGIGLIFGAIIARWEFFRRMAPLLQRVLAVMSSIAFVSEQLPEDIKPWIMWNPIAHGMQLFRGAYFAGYTSMDASPLYFAGGIMALLTVGVSLQRSTRRLIRPA